MTRCLRLWITLSCLTFFSPSVSGQDLLMNVLTKELNREFKQLKAADSRLYYMSYRVEDILVYNIRTSFGAVSGIDSAHYRIFTPSVRLGSYQLDNTHNISFGQTAAALPVTDNGDLLTLAIWKSTDNSYKSSAQAYEQILTSKKVNVAEEDTAADFSPANKSVYYDPPVDYDRLRPDMHMLTGNLAAYSAALKSNPDLLAGIAMLEFKITRKYFTDTKGSAIIENGTSTWQSVYSYTKAQDGMELPLFRMYFAWNPEGLPSPDSVLKDVHTMSAKLTALRSAPIADPYVGPAILSGRAAGVFFHEIFGHRLEGKRMKSDQDGQTFKNKIGTQVLPSFLSITMDPTIKKLDNTQVDGFYRYDDEGVQAQKTNVVQDGILKTFLMTRTPINGVSGSNGHARTAAGGIPESRQSNLIVSAGITRSPDALKQLLRDEAKKQGREYGYYFEDVQGGFTNIGRTTPNAFNVMPIEVYKVFTDGRPDQLVRGVDLIGTPLSMFRRIIAAGNTRQTFNGMCGSNSGWVPVSASSPAIFVDAIETQKKNKSTDRLPVLPRPDLDKEPAR
ncbi:acyl-phosphate glycerol 3-phosphate acyltransferase [Niabella ginsenosidivorans]|uniref:Acyl-phosphate glycerol 3-phosphate acyltransferase n=1 Tax=Niabella ginsenosidivorans TaxID=1176587 RepID=A0A1A9I381_9BACT|nr:metallopeptidase TldD-related protein [Niabella ginsenosidivorans]ANH81142.1 acyl-phosphate glycerol 3-phosphate acyltransferase [Niabella ginsenosidivorans]